MIIYLRRLFIIMGLLALLVTACNLGSTMSPTSETKKLFESWALQVNIPYKNPSYKVINNNNPFATVRVTVNLRSSPMESWLEKQADVECRHVGSEWQCNSSFTFSLTAAEQSRQDKIASGTATAAAIKVQATALQYEKQANATREAIEATQKVILQNNNATATALSLGATQTALAPRPTSTPGPFYLYTDSSWLTQNLENTGWEMPGFDDSAWIPSTIVTYYV